MKRSPHHVPGLFRAGLLVLVASVALLTQFAACGPADEDPDPTPLIDPSDTTMSS